MFNVKIIVRLRPQTEGSDLFPTYAWKCNMCLDAHVSEDCDSLYVRSLVWDHLVDRHNVDRDRIRFKEKVKL